MPERCKVKIRALETPLGVFQIGATDAGICHLKFSGQKGEIDANDAVMASHHIQQAEAWLRTYFENRPLPPLPSFDLSWCSDFGRRVYTALMQVPVGNVITYGALARTIGSLGGARAVGSWMRKNRIPILIPCHRVVPHDGSIGGWSGPAGMKARLLNFEGGREMK